MYYFIETYGTQRREDYRTVLANQLNSNKAFQPGSTFQAYLTVYVHQEFRKVIRAQCILG